MSNENYYEYNGEIDLDSQTLFDYVNQQIDVQKAINNVVPKSPSTFGQAAEPFDGSCRDNLNQDSEQTKIKIQNQNQNQNELQELKSLKPHKNEYDQHSYFKWFIFLLLALIALYFLFGAQLSCGKKKMQIQHLDINTLDTVTPTVGSEFRAIFAK